MAKTILSKQNQQQLSKEINRCWICQSRVQEFLSFGPMPIANGFVTQEQFSQECFTDLVVAFCPNCLMVQLVKQPDREKMFHEEYPFYSGTSYKMTKHFEELSEVALSFCSSDKDSFLVEIGSNDGIFLRNIKEKKIAHLGIEPSKNVAAVSQENGIETWCDFFDESIARKIVGEKGQADLCIAANVMCHIPYLHSVIKGVKELLKPTGVFIFEDPYLGDIFEKVAYDQIYDEHVFYFSLQSVTYLAELYDLEVFDVERQKTHGGSMRYFLAHKGKHEIKNTVQSLLNEEREKGLHLFETCLAFRHNCERSKKELLNLLTLVREAKKRVVGYAATSKSTTVLNYCGIGPDLVEFICDTTPMKQGKFSPGMHIPIKSHDEFKNNYPDYALLFGWNHFDEIMEKESRFSKQGKWITYIPEVKIVSDYES